VCKRTAHIGNSHRISVRKLRSGHMGLLGWRSGCNWPRIVFIVIFGIIGVEPSGFRTTVSIVSSLRVGNHVQEETV